MSSNPSIFGDVVDWFLGRNGDRRQYTRRTGAFHLWWQSGPSAEAMRPGIGVELSPNGLVFIIPDKIAGPEYTLLLRIEESKIPVRVRHVRSDEISHHGTAWNRYMGEFVGIAADHWDRIVRYVNAEAEPVDRRKMQNQELEKQSDDAYRLLPLAIQQKIVAMLVTLHRLEAPPPGQPPLLKLFYGGIVKRPEKPIAHRINVHSRIAVNDELMAYDTRFLVDEKGVVTLA